MSQTRKKRLVVTASLLATIGIVWSVSAARTEPPKPVVNPAKAAPSNDPPHDEAACKCVCKACQAAKVGNAIRLPHEIQSQVDEVREPGAPNEQEIKRQNALALKIAKEIDAMFPSIKPDEPVAIPDNPPPHEGARFDLPYIIEASDVLHIELLISLPERPLMGVFPVRQDGTIGLNYFGTIHVQGLTLEQTKIKLIAHLRTHLTDFTLGLVREDPETSEPIAVDPKDSTHLFIESFDSKSKKFSVLGDVALPSELPFTGNDYVLDAIQKSASFLTTADIDSIYLHRPARGKAPSRTYKIDYRAIEQGKAEANLQLFPGDRLVVGRLAAVQKQLERELRGEFPIENPNLGRIPRLEGFADKNEPVAFNSLKSYLDKVVSLRRSFTMSINRENVENERKRRDEARKRTER